MIKLNKSDEDFNKVLFVTSTELKKDNRDHIKYIKVENDVFVSTDGSRLHECITTLSAENGYYEIIKKTKSKIILDKVKNLDEVYFPDYKDLFNTNIEPVQFTIDNNKSVEYNASKLFADIVRLMGASAINFKFIMNILEIKNGLNYIDIFVDGPDKAIILKGFKCQACIMPLRT